MHMKYSVGDTFSDTMKSDRFVFLIHRRFGKKNILVHSHVITKYRWGANYWDTKHSQFLSEKILSSDANRKAASSEPKVELSTVFLRLEY